MERIDLVLRETERVSEVFVGFGVIDFLVEDLKKRPLGTRLGLLTDARVKVLWGNRLQARLAQVGLKVDLLTIPPGEKSKQWETVRSVFEQMVTLGFDRKSALVAVGGGVVGDVTGFVSSIYMRSIPYAQIPTTLLAQVDSSLGGKTAIDLLQGKNLLGTYYGAGDARVQLATILKLYKKGRIKLDELITKRYSLEEINTGFADLSAGKHARGVVVF